MFEPTIVFKKSCGENPGYSLKQAIAKLSLPLHSTKQPILCLSKQRGESSQLWIYVHHEWQKWELII